MCRGGGSGGRCRRSLNSPSYLIKVRKKKYNHPIFSVFSSFFAGRVVRIRVHVTIFRGLHIFILYDAPLHNWMVICLARFVAHCLTNVGETETLSLRNSQRNMLCSTFRAANMPASSVYLGGVSSCSDNRQRHSSAVVGKARRKENWLCAIIYVAKTCTYILASATRIHKAHTQIGNGLTGSGIVWVVISPGSPGVSNTEI